MKSTQDAFTFRSTRGLCEPNQINQSLAQLTPDSRNVSVSLSIVQQSVPFSRNLFEVWPVHCSRRSHCKIHSDCHSEVTHSTRIYSTIFANECP